MSEATEKNYFVIKDIFNVVRPNKRSSKKYLSGDVPFVSSGIFNNGVDSYKMPKNEEDIDKGNCISVSPLTGSTFYQPKDFLGRGGGGSSIILLYNDSLTENSGLYIATVIRCLLEQKYEYHDMGNSTDIKEEEILLPSIKTQKGIEPNWKYMESYIDNKKTIVNYKVELLSEM